MLTLYHMAQKLTKKQTIIFDFIAEFTKTHDYSPSYREIMSGTGLSSVSAVAEHIDNLVARGVLKKVPNTARSLEIIDTSYPKTTALFQQKLLFATEEETKILNQAAKILDIEIK